MPTGFQRSTSSSYCRHTGFLQLHVHYERLAGLWSRLLVPRSSLEFQCSLTPEALVHHAYHSLRLPSGPRQVGLRQEKSLPSTASLRTNSSLISIPRPGPVSRETMPFVTLYISGFLQEDASGQLRRSGPRGR